MKKYLLFYCVDVADEGNVILSKIYTEQEKNDLLKTKYRASFGNISNDRYDEVEESDFQEISNDEIIVLKKFCLDRINTGIYFKDEDEYEDKDCFSCKFTDCSQLVQPCSDCEDFSNYEDK
jgi:hypothetical protein